MDSSTLYPPEILRYPGFVTRMESNLFGKFHEVSYIQFPSGIKLEITVSMASFELHTVHLTPDISLPLFGQPEEVIELLERVSPRYDISVMTTEAGWLRCWLDEEIVEILYANGRLTDVRILE